MSKLELGLSSIRDVADKLGKARDQIEEETLAAYVDTLRTAADAIEREADNARESINKTIAMLEELERHLYLMLVQTSKDA